MTGPAKFLQGFASMDPQRQREIASLGGRTAHEEGRAHRWTPEKAREAALKANEAKRRNKLAREQAGLKTA